MQYYLVLTKTFKKALKHLEYSGSFDAERFELVISLLKSAEKLPDQYKDHDLKGEYMNCRECHIKSDLLLIYKVRHESKVISLIDIGSHSQLFE